MRSDYLARVLAGLTVVLCACAAHSEPIAESQPFVAPAPTTQPAAASAPTATSSDAGEDSADAPVAADVPRSADTHAGRPSIEVDAGVAAADADVQPEPDAQVGVGSVSQACPVGKMREVGLDESTALGTAREMRDAFVQAVEVLDTPAAAFRWAPRFGATTTIAIGAIEWGDTATYTESDQPGCEDLRLRASIRLSTQDGLLDETVQGSVRGTQFVGSFELAGKLGEWLVERAQHPGLVLQSLGVVFSVYGDQSLVGDINAVADVDDEGLASDLYGLGKFDSSWVRGVDLDAPFQRTAPIDTMCDAAQPADVSASFSPGIVDLSGKLSNVWLRCSGKSTGFPDHDGLAITATGWKHIAYRDGAWIEELGFGHEGAIEILDTSINGPGSQQVAFWDMLPFTFASPSVDLSSSATSLRLELGGRGSYGFEGLYIASDLTVGAAQPAFAEGERAGAAACDKGEAHLHRVGAAPDISAALAGSWVFCSGSFRPDATGIEFNTLGTYNHLAADGGTVVGGLYQIIDTAGFNGAGSTQINLTDFDGTTHIMTVPVQSDAPVKLSFGTTEGRAVLSGR